MVNHSNMKLGKGAVKHDDRTLFLEDYAAKLAPAPVSCNLTSKIDNLGMMLNDQLGDCTCAAVGHVIQQWTAESGSQVIVPDRVILGLYEKVGGYVPGDSSTDNGAVELDVLNYWKRNPVDGHVLCGYTSLRPSNVQSVRNGVYYFGALYIGVSLPVDAQTQDIWEVACNGKNSEPGSWGGHAVTIAAYDEQYVYIVTWGSIKKATWAWLAKYCDEAYALLSKDWICQVDGKCPDGFDFNQLQADLKIVSH